jgi:hypothetical protein
MESAGHRIGTLFELAARMQDGQCHFGSGLRLRRVHAGGNPPAVVDDRDAAIDVDFDLDGFAESGHMFIDTVVDNFVDEVMKSVHAGAADIHRRPLPDRIKAFKHLDLVRAVTVGLGLYSGLVCGHPFPVLKYTSKGYTICINRRNRTHGIIPTVDMPQILIGMTTHLNPGLSDSWIKQGLSGVSICKDTLSPSMTPKTSKR